MNLYSRGLFFGRCKRLPVPHFNDVMTFAKRYHGYMISFGIVYDFHYHPMVSKCDREGRVIFISNMMLGIFQEATVGHLGGFFYQFLLFWQSTSFLHYVSRRLSRIHFIPISLLMVYFFISPFATLLSLIATRTGPCSLKSGC